MIYLRPHHGLCIQHFVGKGYSKEFVDNMKGTIKVLESTPNIEITLVPASDNICSSCPNNNQGNCLSGQKPEDYDKACLSLCNLNFGDVIQWADFKKIVQKNILIQDKLSIVCKGCEWISICQGFYK
jgi:hypothetical protein